VVCSPFSWNFQGWGRITIATIGEVASYAGVGVGTVSRVLNNNSQVSPETRVRVQRAIEHLGYSPRRASGRRPQSASGFIGVLVPFFDQPSSALRVNGIVSGLQVHDLQVVLYSVDDSDRARRRLRDLPTQALDGLIVISVPLRDDEGKRLASARFPTVLIDTKHDLLPSVVIDDRAGGRTATEHLISLGHRRIGFVGEPSRNPFGFESSPNRELGYQDALSGSGIELRPKYMRHGAHIRSSGQQLGSELLRLADRPTAIFASSDVQALGVLAAAQNLGIQPGKDLSVIGYDDIDIAVHSGLTTIRQGLQRSGERGAEIMAGAVASGKRPDPFVEELPLELVVRSTTTSPREA
jgi:DNA-binding LacI/PurR family transcriptional regulator